MLENTGSIAYKAPEMLKGEPYSEVVDSWSAGCVLYMMLSGKHPFLDKNLKEMKKKVKFSKVTFEDEEWNFISNEAKDLIKGLLMKN